MRKLLLATNYSGIGYVQLLNLETDKAVESLRTALQFLGADPTGDQAHDRSLAILYARLGNALNEVGRNPEAIASYEKAIAIAEDLVRRFPSNLTRRGITSLYMNIVGPLAGRETLNAGEVQRAQIFAQKALLAAEELVASDSTNIQARSDLAFAYTKMADSLYSTRPAAAREWYEQSIAVTKQLGPRTETKRDLADRDETLASVLTVKGQWPERLQLVREANTIRQEMVRTGPNTPLDRMHLMRSYCRLSDAELRMTHVESAKQHADSAVPFFTEFKLISPSLVVLRDMGFCYESLGDVQRQAAMDWSLPSTERETAATASRDWYAKSAAVWNEWVKRGAATPESEIERHKVEHLLRSK